MNTVTPMDVDDQEDLLGQELPKLLQRWPISPDDRVIDMAVLLRCILDLWGRDGLRVEAKSTAELELMLNTNSDLLQAFQTARSTRKFEKVLELYREKIESHRKPKFLATGSVLELAQSFQEPFRGNAVQALKEYLRESNILFHSVYVGKYYGKFFSIVQSSGTGKSRLIIELSEDGVLVIYICLRSKHDIENFPPRDKVPATILLENLPSDGDDYLRRCYHFLAALFKTICDALQTLDGTNKSKAKAWNARFGPNIEQKNERNDFFKNLQTHFDELERNPVSPKPQNYAPDGTQPSVAQSPRDIMISRYQLLTQALAIHFPAAEHDPQVVLAFDEAHTLATTHIQELQYSPSDYLCRALGDLTCVFSPAYSFWVIFASTSTRVSDFAAPSIFHRSQRVPKHGDLIVPPYTLTNWDVFAPAMVPNCADLQNVGRYSHLSGFGRPLWHGFIGGPDKALSLAQQKLVFGDFKPSDQNQALAILGQRFGLDVIFGHPETTAFLDEAVASHMRICLSVTADRLRLNTSYPSEPVLSNAAASLLHERDDSVEACLKALNATLQRGMVDKGQRGEMLSRILLLLGRDAATPPAPAQTPPGFLRYCQPIKLLDFLKVTFGDYFTSAAIQSDFENAYINISHWVSMKENIVPSRKRMGGDFEPKTFLLRLWLRSAGIQCAHDQPGTDKIGAIYFDDPSEPKPENRMSSFLNSDKLKESDHAASHKGLFPWNSAIQLETGRPSVVITCDMGVEPQVPIVVYETKFKKGRKCLKIHARGTSRVSFPFMTEAVERKILLLTKDAMNEDLPYPIGEKLAKRFEFARSSDPEYMDWSL